MSLLCTSCTSSNSSESEAQAESNDVKRVVALTSLSADIIARLDSSKLVGIPDNKLLTENTDLENVTHVSQGRTQPNLEQIVALKPDLIIGADGFHDQILSKAKSLGITTMVSDIENWKSLETFYTKIAAQLNQDASVISNELTLCQSKNEPKAKSGLILVSNQPILAPNKSSWAGDLLMKYNIQNPVASMQGNAPIKGYVTLSEEQVLVQNPDHILVVNSSPETLTNLKTKPFWNQLKAVQNNNIQLTEYYGLINPGSIQSIQSACQQLNDL